MYSSSVFLILINGTKVESCSLVSFGVVQTPSEIYIKLHAANSGLIVFCVSHGED